MSADALCANADCRIVRFMFHDRVSFGGTLIAVAVLYAWLAAFPLRHGQSWAWWAFLGSGALGFASFLTCLGYGYLDSWHLTASVVLFAAFAGGLGVSRRLAIAGDHPWLRSDDGRRAALLVRAGRRGILTTGAGIALAGLVILYIGTTEVFVATDLEFMGLTRTHIDGLNPHLIPLIAHDRAGFGGGLATVGMLLLVCGWFAPPSRAFHQALLLAGTAGFGCAIGTHFVEGYLNTFHLAPAMAGAALFAGSLACEWVGWRTMRALR